MTSIGIDAFATAIDKHLIAKALPGELDGFDRARRREAAQFIATAALARKPGKPVIALDALGESEDRRRRIRLAIVNDDMPFLVDSIAAAIGAEGIAIDRVIHPVVSVRRDAKGVFEAIDAKAGKRESIVYMELERVDARARRALIDTIERDLTHVRAAVTDWGAMQTAMRADAERLEGEGRALLSWFLDRHFTLLAHEMWDADKGQRDPLGIARHQGDVPLLADASCALALKWFADGREAPLLLKSNRISTVHRHVQLDLVIVPVSDGHRVTGLSIHAGLWTSSALNAPPQDIPVLRQRLADLEGKLGFDPAGHAGKALTHALVALPHDQVIGFTPDCLEEVALAAMSLADRPRPKLVNVRSPLGRHLFAFVWLPRDEVTTARRNAIGAMLEQAANAKLLSWSIALEDGVLAMLRYTLDMRGGGVLPDPAKLDAELERMVRGWSPTVEAALAAQLGEARAARLTLRWAGEFPQGYRYANSAEEAARDAVRLDRLDGEGAREVRIAPGTDRAGAVLLKIYKLGAALPLSDAVPVLENFGFRVIEERPTRLETAGLGYIHEFHLEAESGAATLKDGDATAVLEESIARVLAGQAENDAFNTLILAAGLRPDAVLLFRAWFRYLRQTGLTYGMTTVVEALRRAPKLAMALVQRFAAAHDPAQATAGEDATSAADRAVAQGLDKVTGIDDDRIIRALRGVISATLRTNAYAPSAREALAFKLDSAKVPGLPAPLPWREIFVYAPRVEGIHLRAGPIARGGLRWSDRRDDFRTEVLGLMKAQRVKNAVIVPTGAKGGFYPKQLPNASNRDAWMAEGTESYRIFIRALLSLTDNIVDGKVVHPPGVVIHDGEDPYFVVAADKGTATFSDVANAIAIEHGFWLGDAFASGGSNGYDHKAMGITAKGAWISVQRHFAERGVDVQADPIRVVGCGDMSGDVFGNGMLLSKSIRLQAAFDHRHIFLDPDPDPAASWEERARLFALPRSSWADYAGPVSAGGGVHSRAAKSITLTKQVRAMLGVEDKELEPSALISAILKAPVDLIWFGGIGTYVKASGEANAEVGDPANDRLRINAEQVRATAIGEGANLGVTQAGRIAFAAHGGRINTDFIDNSAGVDCSDNEVNIKIALNREMIEGRLKQPERDKLLVRMTDDVAHLVLEDNRLQTIALSVMENDGAPVLPSYVRLIEILEASGRLDRAVEGLAGNEELLRRAQDGAGLTRPELSVLLATGKLALQDAIERSPLDGDPATVADLHAAFPAAMQKRFPDAIDAHRLRGEIIATKLANRIVNRLGVLHPFELAEEEGAALADIAAMYVAAEQLFDLPALFRAIENAGELTEAARILLLDEAAYGVRVQVADLLRAFRPGTSPAAVVAALGNGVGRLDREADALLAKETRTQAGRIAEELAGKGAPAHLTRKVVKLFELDGAVGLADLAQRLKIDEIVLTRAFIELGQALGLDWAQANAARITPSDPWERLLIAGLARDFQQLRLDFLARAKTDPSAMVTAWLADNGPRVAQFRALIDRARRVSLPNAAMLAQIASQARVLLGR